MYSIGVSSPISLLALNLVAGNAFGVIRSKVWPRELVTFTFAMVTAVSVVSIRSSRGMVTRVKITSRLVGQAEGRCLIRPAADVAHDQSAGCRGYRASRSVVRHNVMIHRARLCCEDGEDVVSGMRGVLVAPRNHGRCGVGKDARAPAQP
jgi:hypothetical protein